jgi:HSP20 family protein
MNTFFTNSWPQASLFARRGPALLEDLLAPALGEIARTEPNTPSMDVWSDENAVHVKADLPGVALEDLELSVFGDRLSVKGERTDQRDPAVTSHRSERELGPFERVVWLPFEVEADAVAAELKDGVLHVTLPKSEALKPRRVPVISGADSAE